MQNPLNKRFKRDLKSDAGKYIAIFLFIVFFIGAASGFLVADNSVLAMFDDVATKYNIEDGHISFMFSLIKVCSLKLRSKMI